MWWCYSGPSSSHITGNTLYLFDTGLTSDCVAPGGFGWTIFILTPQYQNCASRVTRNTRNMNQMQTQSCCSTKIYCTNQSFTKQTGVNARLSLDNKMDHLRLQLSNQSKAKDCCVLILTPTFQTQQPS